MPEPRFDAEAPWKQRYRIPETYGLEIAAQAPTRGLVLSNRSGAYQLHSWNVVTGDLTQVTFRPEGFRQGAISPDGAFLYYHDDQKGNEVGHLVRVPFAGGVPEDITPAFPLYECPDYRFCRTGQWLAFLAATQEGFALYRMPISSDSLPEQPEKLFQTEHLTQQPGLSYNGEIVTVTTADQPGTLHYSVLAFDAQSGAQIGRLTDEEASVEGGRFAPLPGDLRVLVTSDKSGVRRPAIWNPTSGERDELAIADLQGEVSAIDWSPDAKRLLLYQFWQASSQLYLYDIADRHLILLQQPAGSLVEGAVYFRPDGDICAHQENATTPIHLILLDGETGKQKQTVFAAPESPPSRLWSSVTFASSDGQQIQAWLGVPEGSGPFPTILEMHGGPTWVKSEQFDPRAQCWLDAGFAFLSLNYRGSTTFGKAFQEQINGHIGDWELEDMVAARQWLVDQGIAHPGQVFLTGWSYGGYLTLLGLGRRPDLWAGGMAGVAFGDYVIAYEDEAEFLKAYDRGLMGGTPEERPEAYRKSSAMTYLEQVSAPLLIIQGHNDTRCPPRSIEVYEKRARELKKPVEVFWFDAGHGSLETAQRIEHQERMLRFACQVLADKR
ncbi:MAG TPA: prolyl oligopeptidase family serine peptidase [Ktedonobacteraceae bacterium]|nr:prolyl oligopeptidase family serine peptidase [Ktedonobacteraceae bacterium]